MQEVGVSDIDIARTKPGHVSLAQRGEAVKSTERNGSPGDTTCAPGMPKAPCVGAAPTMPVFFKGRS